MPHWINLSFYSTNKKVAYSTFIPRIKLPPLLSQTNEKGQQEFIKLKFLTDNQNEYIHNSLFDYDAYDAQIFQLPPAHGTWYETFTKYYQNRIHIDLINPAPFSVFLEQKKHQYPVWKVLEQCILKSGIIFLRQKV